jgi:hypothetical protein
MNVVIQRLETREFLESPPDDWVRDPRDAMPFKDMRAAMAYCRKHGLENVRLVAFFGANRVSFLLYLPGCKTPTPAGALKPAAA